jgi:peptidyl-prolyl cis-trans isomerase SurA
MTYTVAPMPNIRRTLIPARSPTLRAVALALSLALALAAAPARAVVIDGIAAVVNGEVITLLELEKAGRAPLEERLRNAPAADQERLRRQVLGAVLDQLILTRIQVQRARQLGIQVSAAEVDAAIAAFRQDNRMSEETLGRLLQEQGLTEEEHRRTVENQLRFSRLAQREVRAKVTATDEEIAAYFNEHRQEWSRPEKLRFRHLLVPLPAQSSAEEIEAARAKANALYIRARAGEDFAALVRAETPGAKPDADPISGEIARGELFPALDETVFALPAGGVGKPVQSPAGFHLVQVVDKTPAFEPKLDEVRASIEQKIGDRKARERYDGWLRQLRADAIVEIRY